MNKNYYELYISSVFSLAETLVIKSEDTAATMNSVIAYAYGENSVDPYDKTTWKYYMNVCGQYHFTDSEIQIKSLDTLQTINFTRENLTVNTATKKAYEYGSRNYIELVSLYPDSEMLILGVLYPADMNHAINSPDGSILSYPPSLVENNEYTFIKNLEEYIRKFNIRWHSNQFGLAHAMYTTTYLGLLYLNLVPAIINLRQRACKTNEAHSFHVRQYLASHGMLDLYLDQMTTKQALFFYRNIAYIERNNGKRFIFQWLLEHIMTERNLPIAEYTMKHDVSVMPSQLYPAISFNKKALNINRNSTNKTKYTLDDLLTKESLLVDGNIDYIAENKIGIDSVLKNSLSSVVATKVLESSVIDYTNATPYTLHDIALNHWLYLSSNGTYETFLTFKNPKTGEDVSIQCKDAFTLFVYVFSKYIGGNPLVIPKMLAKRVIRLPRATVADLLSVSDTKYATAKDAQNILSFMPTILKTVSVDEFKRQINSLFNAAQYQLNYIANTQHQYRTGIVQNMVSQVYCDAYCYNEPNDTLYSDWLVDKNLPTDSFSDDEYFDIYKQLFEAATGSDLESTADISALQKAMINLFKQLSSYSIQFVYEVIGTNLKLVNDGTIRIGDISNKSKGNIKVLDLNVDVLDRKAKSMFSGEMEVGAPYVGLFNTKPGKQNEHMEITVKPSFSKDIIGQKRIVNIGSMSIDAMYTRPELNGNNEFSFIGYERFLDTKNPIYSGIKDIYCDCFDGSEVIKVNISSVILDVYYNAFEHMGIVNPDIETFSFVDATQNTSAFEVVGSSSNLDAFKLNSNTDNLDALNN